jgi:uncharacterized protein (TIGR02266 family)
MSAQKERRPSERRVRVRCATWRSFLDLHAKNISRGGLFLRSDQPAAPGSAVTVELCLPDGRTLRMGGEVAHVVAPGEAAKHGRPAGMGVRFAPLGADGLIEMEVALRDAQRSAEERGSTPRPPTTADAPSGSADFEDPDLLDALRSYVVTLRSHDPIRAIGMEPGAQVAEMDARLETLAERFAPEWYAERSAEVRAAAAEVALALRDVHRRIHADETGTMAASEDGGAGLSAGALFGDLEFLDQRSMTGEAGPVSVSERDAAEWLRAGVALLRNHRYREAGEMLKRALDANPANAECRRDYHLALGHELREAGRLDEAAHSFDKALRADPLCNEAAAELRAISSRRGGGGGKSRAILGRLLRK